MGAGIPVELTHSSNCSLFLKISRIGSQKIIRTTIIAINNKGKPIIFNNDRFVCFCSMILKVYIFICPLTTLFICVIMQNMEFVDEKKVNFRYVVNQEVVYPLHGVGKIKEIQERNFRDKVLIYYVIYIEVSDMTVMVPVDKADELGIRPIVTPEISQKALKVIEVPYEPVPSDWKLRYQMNLDLLKSGTVEDIASVVKTLYHRSKIKELPILERKLFDSALKLLIDEVSSSLGKDKKEVEEMIFKKMEDSVKNVAGIVSEPPLDLDIDLAIGKANKSSKILDADVEEEDDEDEEDEDINFDGDFDEDEDDDLD